MIIHYKDLIAEANAVIRTVPTAEAIRRVGDPNVLFVDLRDTPELERDGRIPGAVHATRGMLEFLIDPASPYHNDVFSSGRELLFYCASGGRSALAAQTAQRMGLPRVAHVGGGLKAWKEAGGPVEPFCRQ
jgi:rhodanese-related sulfurtransferase